MARKLAPILYDRFQGSSLGSQWVSGLWSGGAYSPTIGAGVLTHSNPGAGAYVGWVSYSNQELRSKAA